MVVDQIDRHEDKEGGGAKDGAESVLPPMDAVDAEWRRCCHVVWCRPRLRVGTIIVMAATLPSTEGSARINFKVSVL